MCITFGKKRVKQWQATRALAQVQFQAPAANPGPTVLVESYFPFAEPMGICRGQAEDRLKPTYLHLSKLPGSAEPFQGWLMASLPTGAPLILQNRSLGWTHLHLEMVGVVICSKKNKLPTKKKKVRKGNDSHQCRGELGFVVCAITRLDAQSLNGTVVAVRCHVTNEPPAVALQPAGVDSDLVFLRSPLCC